MDKVATSNRCLWDVTQLAHDEWVTVGDNAHGSRERVPFKDSIEGYQWLRPGLRPMELSSPGSADFNSYATRWEKRYSALISDRSAHLTFVPVVDQIPFFSTTLIPAFGGTTMSMFPVIAHYGTVHVSDIIVRRKFATDSVGRDRVKALESILDQDVASVEEGYPDAGDWGSFAQSHNIGPNFFKVLTDPEGRILANLGGFGAEPGLESEDPVMTLLMIADGIALVRAGARAGGRMIIRMLARRAAREAVVDFTGRVTAEQMETYLSKLLKTRPYLGRLVKARGLQGAKLTEETIRAMEEWAKQPGKTLKWVKDGVVQRATGLPGNTASLSIFENTLVVEETAIANPAEFYKQVAHDLAADTVGTVVDSTARDVAWVGAEKMRHNTALGLLDHAFNHGWEQMLQWLRGLR
jgi:hypothetical protein